MMNSAAEEGFILPLVVIISGPQNCLRAAEGVRNVVSAWTLGAVSLISNPIPFLLQKSKSSFNWISLAVKVTVVIVCGVLTAV